MNATDRQQCWHVLASAAGSHRTGIVLAVLMVAGAFLSGCTTIRPAGDAGRPIVEAPVFSHDAFDRVLQQYVDDRGRVDYAGLRANPRDLEAYYRLLTGVSPDSHPEKFPDRDHRLAYWLNAYNAAVIKTVLTYYPIDSVLDVRTPVLFFYLTDKAGFFLFQRLTFGGATTSLYFLENKVIRPRFDDPRIHFALNCAARSCPRLPRHAFTGEALDRQLDRETRLFLSEARNFRIDHDEGVVYLSSIFKWYEDDFTGWLRGRHPDRDPDLLTYAVLYLPPEASRTLETVAGRYTIRYLPYDWGLNDQRAAHP
jgi:hypothetical protein